jgi:Leucine-rich repeat (LRR) protein
VKTIPSSRIHRCVAIISVFVITLVLIAGTVGCGGGLEGEAVTFADPNLEAAVREAIAIPEGPIYPSGLDRLTSLNATAESISDLTGLEHAISLTDLDLRWNEISDISPLANLTSLTGLQLRDNQISDISPLANLTSLTDLNLWLNQISDISPLANLTSLTDLLLSSSQISDISPLVQNVGLAEGDHVFVGDNPLNSDSINIYMPQLEARGVNLLY